MLTLASGLAFVVGNGAPINGLPTAFGQVANTQILGLTIPPVLLMILGIVGFGLMMRRTTYGLRIYAVGGNRLASEIAGVKTGRVLFSVYAISGAWPASPESCSHPASSAAHRPGPGYELDAIAAVVIGGASLMGGRGTIWGTVLGLLLIQTLNNGLDILTVPPAYWQDVIKGVLIVTAVAIDVWASKRRT